MEAKNKKWALACFPHGYSVKSSVLMQKKISTTSLLLSTLI